MLKKTILCTFALLNLSNFAAEVDSFTYRNLPLEDSLEVINEKTNHYLAKAIERTNSSSDECDEKKLYRVMRKYFNNQYRGELGREIVETQDIDSHWITIQEGIFQDFNWYQAPIQGFWGRVAKDPTAALIKVNGVFLGTDKFEHFMGSGYRYFKKYHLQKKGIRAALDIGYKAETGIMGAWMTGVKSHGDLIANFNGMRFWNHILQKNDDVLGAQYNAGPYVACEKGMWKQVKSVDWATYIDQAFDEGQNCSSFRTQEMANDVDYRISLVAKKEGIELKCPMNRELIEPLLEKYGPFADELINLEGHTGLD